MGITLHEHKCLGCEVEFKHKLKVQKYCSKDCYNKNRHKSYIEVPYSEERKQKIALKTKLQHQKYKETKDTSVYDKISEANSVPITKTMVSRVKRVLQKTLSSSDTEIAKKSGISKRVLYNIIEKDDEVNTLFEERFKFAPMRLRKMNEDEVDDFFEYIKKESADKVIKKYRVGLKPLLRIYAHFGIERVHKKANRKETKPERQVRELLQRWKVDFEQEAWVGNGIRCDFLVYNKLIIEVQGDYWHANPDIYTEEHMMNEMQLSRRIDDEKRFNYYKEKGYELYVIWENNLKTQFEKEKNKLKLKLDEYKNNNRKIIPRTIQH